MSTYDDLLRQVESLRQVNSSLQREIQDNNAQLSRLQESSTHLAQYTGGTGSQTPRSQANSSHVSRPTNIHSPQISRAQTGQTQSDRQTGIQQMPHPQHSSAHNIQNTSGVNQLSRLQESLSTSSASR